MKAKYDWADEAWDDYLDDLAEPWVARDGGRDAND